MAAGAGDGGKKFKGRMHDSEAGINVIKDRIRLIKDLIHVFKSRIHVFKEKSREFKA